MSELESLDEVQCLGLLATQDLGRFAVIIDGYPMVFPVNYVLDGDVVIFRTSPGSKLDAAVHSNISFEVDHMESDRSSGWSVLVTGAVDRMGMTEQERERVTRLDVRPLAPGDKPAWVRLVPERITGRRFCSTDQSFAMDAHGYL